MSPRRLRTWGCEGCGERIEIERDAEGNVYRAERTQRPTQPCNRHCVLTLVSDVAIEVQAS